VTQPDPVAALAAQFEEQLKELRGQLARSQGEVGVLRERLEASTGQVIMFRVEVKQLREALAEAIDKRQLAPPPAPWWVVDEATGRELLAALREWVEFLRRQYPGYLARLPRCWPNHAEAVWELSTIGAEWERIYSDEDNRDLAGALTWHDRYLPDAIFRLAASIKCDETGCLLARPHP
jgi:hypothetical protein